MFHIAHLHWTPATAFICTIFVCLVIIKTEHLHIKWSAGPHHGVQNKLNEKSASRFGGVAVGFSILVVGVLGQNSLLLTGLFATAGIFFVGIIEDLTSKVTPALRLVAMFVSGLLVCFIHEISLTHFGVDIIDNIVSNPAVKVIVTTLFLVALTNAVNLIDGANGLAAGNLMIAMLALANFVELPSSSEASIALATYFWATFGFMLLNFITGRIFLGDAGAYFLGMNIGLLALIIQRIEPGLTALTLLIFLFYPAAELCVTVLRRLLAGANIFKPDVLHLHSILQMIFSAKLKKRNLSSLGNQLTSVVITGCNGVYVGCYFIFDWKLFPEFIKLGYAVFGLVVYLAAYFYLISALKRMFPASEVKRS